MANLTKAQRHNRMLDNAFNIYNQQQQAKKDLLPTCSEYSFFLGKAQEILKITINEARTMYGQFTYGQWKELLQLF